MDCLILLSVTSEIPVRGRESKLSHALSNQVQFSAGICIAVQTLKIIFTPLFQPQQILADALVMLLDL